MIYVAMESDTSVLFVRSLDSGRTWEQRGGVQGTSKAPIFTTGISFVNTDTGYFSNSWGDVYKTTNGGGTFSTVHRAPLTDFGNLSIFNDGLNRITVNLPIHRSASVLHVVDLLGREVLTRPVSLAQSSLDLDISLLPSGAYLAEFEGYRTKFLVTH